MVYSSVVKSIFRAVYGEPPELNGKGGLVLVADGVGGLDLCGTGLRYVVGALGLPVSVRLVRWGHGFGRWHSDLTNAANRDLKATQAAEEVRAFREEHPGAPVFLVGKSGG